MNSSTRTKVTSALLLTFLCACGSDRTSAPMSFPSQAMPASGMASSSSPVASQRHEFDNVDAYKNDVAEHIMRYNGAHTFSGDLPPMLPAIVVLRITVDRQGRLTDVWVQRSRDDEASRVALDSMYRSGPLPRPANLIVSPENSLTFSETFLFNDDYRFQLRSLASPQIP